jgi:hypothetical protein
MAEATPLLADIDENTAHIDDEFEKTPASAHFKRLIRVLTIIAVVLSAVTVALLIANYIIFRHAPLRYYNWDAKDATKKLGTFMFITLVLSVINVFVNLPILLNIIVDIILAAGIIPRVIRLIRSMSTNWCKRGYIRPGIPAPEPHPKCEDWKLVVKILMGTAAGLGIIVFAIYLGLLILRSIALIRTKFWKRPATWTFPTGQLSFEVSIKLLKQETGNVGQSAEAGPSSGHGPLHL